ncbi:MAG: type 4a pilus biogenesis protein PilO [Blastocatellia bacterium]|nr:type 4a pilus biogenesis protein PilO [Blastocatellia bacterium]MBL8193673.1 type 4a pilus biogenesis protein PilO [Blastocatellia bacterium]MBN8721772.1 type 4a pilus biogenesis protein PilO [Acidobacteriota bacterium]
MIRALLIFLTIIFLTFPSFAQQKRPKKSIAPETTQQTNEKKQLQDAQNEIASLLEGMAKDEEDISNTIGQIKNELRLRELRWRTFERSTAVKDEPFVFHPVKVELFGTYERVTDMLLNLAASNYLIIIDGLDIKRTKQPAPLVSVEAEFTMLIYSLDEKEAEKMQNPTGQTTTAQLTSAQNTLMLLNSRFEERVAVWTALRRLGKRFPKSLETVLTGVSMDSRLMKITGVSRSAETVRNLINEVGAAKIFTDISPEQNGPNFTIQANLDVPKAYQQWLEGVETSDQDLQRDPFTTIYTLEQLIQGSNANANYPDLEKRIAEYLQLVNQPNIKRLDRSSPYLVSELSLAGTYFTSDLEGAIFKTPNQKELFVSVGAKCYNGRFVAVQQGRALFEENIVDSSGKTQISQIAKSVDSPNCSVVSIPINGKETTISQQLEQLAKAKLPNTILTLKVSNVRLDTLLLLMYELSNYQFAFIIDKTIPALCISISQERGNFNDVLAQVLHSVNLTFVEEKRVFRIIAFEQAINANLPVLATSFENPPLPGKFGTKDFQAEELALSITEVELGEVIKFFTNKYKVKFAYTATAKQIKVTAAIKDLPWPQVFMAILRANDLTALVESERVLILSRTELLQLQTAGKVKIEE